MTPKFWYGFLFFGLVEMSFGKVPDYLHLCKSNDPDLANCIINSIYFLQPKLKDGMPELEVPSMEPLELDAIRIKNGLQVNLTDLKVWGNTNFKIAELKVNVPKNRFAFIVLLPFLHFEAKYEVNSKILLLNLQGKGPVYGNFTDYSFTGILNGKRVQQNGEEYLKFEKMKLKIQFGHSEMKLENLFNGNPTLGRAVNDIINDSNEALLNEIKPSLESAIAEKFTDIANKITLRFPIKELFL